MNVLQPLLNKVTSLSDFFAGVDVGSLTGSLFKVFIIYFLARICLRTLKGAARKIFYTKQRRMNDESLRREKTLLRLIESLLNYVIWFIAIMVMLTTLGINTRPILAGAGILGVAVGFGAQSFVKDFLSGFFIIFEDQFAVGDQVKINGLDGTVEIIGLRTTKLAGPDGEKHIIQNGNITLISNYSLGEIQEQEGEADGRENIQPE